MTSSAPLLRDARWFTIAAHRPFLDDLAAGLHAAFSPDGPEALAEAVVLVPTRRAARALAESFVRAAGGGAVLLPQVRAIGALEEGEPPFEPGNLALELPPAISPLRRRFELARLSAEHERRESGATLDAPAALAHGDALGALLDDLYIEERFDADAIDGLIDGELARHWERSARFLAVATRAWPRRLEELGLIDPADRRVRLLRLLAEQWDAHPPGPPLIAAGAVGNAPAMVAVLGAVARAPQGCVVLPGLDLELAEEAWAQIDDQHPQAAMKRLLGAQGVTRDEVATWPAVETADAAQRGRARRRVVNEALRPATATADWLRQIDVLRERAGEGGDPIAAGLEGLSLVTARTEEEAATVAALILRETLETPDKTCALVTPDLALARRVSARLQRWGIEADSSAGTPLATYPVGQLIALVAQLALDPLDPVVLLAVAKHPLARLGREPEALDPARRELERYGLRGVRPRSREALMARLAERPEARALAEDLLRAGEGLAAAFADAVAPAEAARALTASLETLSSPRLLWSGGAGELAAGLLAGLIGETEGAPRVTASGFAELIETLLAEETVRVAGAHPRLRILGLIEARLVRADRLVLAGLEEGVWPRPAATDPFLSRPMRKALGLPSPERRIGQAAHDFAQGASAPEVVLLTTERRGGQPAVRSRWLWRLETLVKGTRAHGEEIRLPDREDALAWARALDAPLTPAPPRLKAAERPMPRPPLSARPRELPVTRIETWVRDPYAVYARTILQLKALDPPDQPIDARVRGTAVHAAFERLALEHPDLPPDVAEAFERLLREELEKAGFDPARMARERALAANLARWVDGFERERRAGAALVIEKQGRLGFDCESGKTFTVTAKADRIELKPGYAAVLDFKTGLPPSDKQVRTGFSPQLTLTAAILQAGGFADCGAVEAQELVYVRVTGRRVPAEVVVRGEPGHTGAWASSALEGLKRRVAMFDREETPYASWSAPQFLKDRAGDYDHLARLYEWAVAGGEDGEAGGEA